LFFCHENSLCFEILIDLKDFSSKKTKSFF
jgi:hypothetical protein